MEKLALRTELSAYSVINLLSKIKTINLKLKSKKLMFKSAIVAAFIAAVSQAVSINWDDMNLSQSVGDHLGADG